MTELDNIRLTIGMMILLDSGFRYLVQDNTGNAKQSLYKYLKLAKKTSNTVNPQHLRKSFRDFLQPTQKRAQPWISEHITL